MADVNTNTGEPIYGIALTTFDANEARKATCRLEISEFIDDLSTFKTNVQEDDLARESIDAQIAIHEAAIIRLKNKRNELSYIARLPPEILCKVFLAYIKQQHDPPETAGLQAAILALCRPSRDEMAFHWTDVTHVCRHWREVGLSCPEMWSNISVFSSKPRVLAMLERSKQAPISVTIHRDLPPQMEQVIVKTLSQASRLKSLIIFDSTPVIQEQLANMREAPCLETLELFGDIFSVPATFLTGGSPKLRRVSISGWRAGWNLPFLQGITFLKRSNPRSVYNIESFVTKSRSGDFVSALKSMPMLEELHIDDTFPNFKAREGDPVPLPHLKRLCLRGTAEECTGALNCMALPPSAILEIRCKFSGGDRDTVDVPALLSALHSSWMSNPLTMPNPLPPFASLQIADGLAETALRLFPQHIDLDAWTNEPTAALTISVHGSTTALEHITSALPLNAIRSLNFSDPDNIDYNCFQALQSMTLLGMHAAHRFINFLAGDPAFRPIIKKPKRYLRKFNFLRLGLDRPVAAIVYLPALKSLKLSQANFSSRSPSDSLSHIHAIDVEVLLDLLMWRYEHGGELERLSLEGCFDLWQADVNRIREVVVDVDWDGEEWSISDVLYADDDYFDSSDDYSMDHDDYASFDF